MHLKGLSLLVNASLNYLLDPEMVEMQFLYCVIWAWNNCATILTLQESKWKTPAQKSFAIKFLLWL